MPPNTLQTVIKNAPAMRSPLRLSVASDKSGNLEHAEGEWREALRLRPDLAGRAARPASPAMRQG